MMAADYRHIDGLENRLGRHYSRFPPFSPTPALADQSLALRKLRDAGSNRRRRVNALPTAPSSPPAQRAALIRANQSGVAGSVSSQDGVKPAGLAHSPAFRPCVGRRNMWLRT